MKKFFAIGLVLASILVLFPNTSMAQDIFDALGDAMGQAMGLGPSFGKNQSSSLTADTPKRAVLICSKYNTEYIGVQERCERGQEANTCKVRFERKIRNSVRMDLGTYCRRLFKEGAYDFVRFDVLPLKK